MVKKSKTQTQAERSILRFLLELDDSVERNSVGFDNLLRVLKLNFSWDELVSNVRNLSFRRKIAKGSKAVGATAFKSIVRQLFDSNEPEARNLLLAFRSAVASESTDPEKRAELERQAEGQVAIEIKSEESKEFGEELQPSDILTMPQDVDTLFQSIPIAEPERRVPEELRRRNLPKDIEERLQTVDIDFGVRSRIREDLRAERESEEKESVARSENRLANAVNVFRQIPNLQPAGSINEVVAAIADSGNQILPVVQVAQNQIEELKRDLEPAEAKIVDRLGASLLVDTSNNAPSVISTIPWLLAFMAFGQQRATSKFGAPSSSGLATLLSLVGAVITSNNINDLDSVLKSGSESGDSGGEIEDFGDGEEGREGAQPPDLENQRPVGPEGRPIPPIPIPNKVPLVAAAGGVAAGIWAQLKVEMENSNISRDQFGEIVERNQGNTWRQLINDLKNRMGNPMRPGVKEIIKAIIKKATSTDAPTTDAPTTDAPTTDAPTGAPTNEIKIGKDDIVIGGDLDNEGGSGDLRPNFFELGTDEDTETADQALAERIRFAMFNHIDEGFGHGKDNPLYLQNKRWNEQVRYVNNHQVKTDFVNVDRLAYYLSRPGRTSMINVSNLKQKTKSDNQLLLESVINNASKLHPICAMGGRFVGTPMSNIYPTNDNTFGFKISNQVINPPEGTSVNFAPNNKAYPIKSLPSGLAFSTGIYQTGISPTSYF